MRSSRRLIVFFIPPEKVIGGGILSIFSLCKTSREFYDIHRSDVILCVFPGYKSYKKNDLFDNDERIYSFDEVIRMGDPQYLQLHVPEGSSPEVFDKLQVYVDFLKRIPDLRVNIMNQNILYMPKPVIVSNWFCITPHVTQTTAHDKYSTQELADRYNTPMQHLSIYLDPSQYNYRGFEKKENLIVLSEDTVPEKEHIVEKLKRQLPEYKIVTVKDMHYDDYKELVGKAKYTITFGEGFDGYYLETFFSGGITFAVYNDDFFPDKEFSTFENTYDGYDTMLLNITKDVQLFNNKLVYEQISKKNLKKLTKLYSFSHYRDNLRDFYLQRFMYVPQKGSAERLISSIVEDKVHLAAQHEAAMRTLSSEVNHYTSEVKRLNIELQEQSTLVVTRDQIIAKMTNSISWKVTQPLRKIAASIRK